HILMILCMIFTESSIYVTFFFSSRRRHTRFSRDWSSDVCSSDLELSINNWGDAVIQAIEEGVKRFEALNPGIKVEVRRRGTWDDFVVRVVSGVPPDVIAIGLSIGEHSEAGLIIPLDSYIGGDLREQIIPEMWS